MNESRLVKLLTDVEFTIPFLAFVLIVSGAGTICVCTTSGHSVTARQAEVLAVQEQYRMAIVARLAETGRTDEQIKELLTKQSIVSSIEQIKERSDVLRNLRGGYALSDETATKPEVLKWLDGSK